VSIVGHYIKERTAGAQFVVISLRNNMFELAERLVRGRERREGSGGRHGCALELAELRPSPRPPAPPLRPRPQVGVYKTDNSTKTVACNPAAFVVGPHAAGRAPQPGAAAMDADEGPENAGPREPHMAGPRIVRAAA
jgi:structural maintenance of chromosome 4